MGGVRLLPGRAGGLGATPEMLAPMQLDAGSSVKASISSATTVRSIYTQFQGCCVYPDETQDRQ